MEELRHRKNIDQLLHDKSFILWCLFPTEESDKQWKENYLSLYPEEAETLMLAREKVCRLKFNHVRLAFAEKTALKKRILDNYEKHRKPKYIRLSWLFAAACFVDILVFGIFILAVSRSVECGIEHFGLS